MSRIFLFFFSLIGCATAAAQNITVQEYIETYKGIAMEEMKRSGVPASVTLAQGILETEYGNSNLVRRSNNHFGIKCKSNWTGMSVSHDDDARGECFRKYNSAEESYRDHSNFLRNSSRYAFLFDLDPTDYRGWAKGLKKAGYATNPKYPDILIRNIEENKLMQYDGNVEGGMEFELKKEIGEEKNSNVQLKADNQMNTAHNLSSIKAGKTLFNGLKAVYVSRGTSLLAVATEFELPLSRLLEYNDKNADGLLNEDQWVFLEKKMKQGKRAFYNAGNNENLYGISQNLAIQLSSLVEFNNLEPYERIRQGMQIRLQPASADENNTADERVKKIHSVREKEGLYAISRQYNVTVDELKIWNNLLEDQLKAGQQIIIYK